MIRLFALSSQHDHVDQVLAWLKTNNMAVEHAFTDLNVDAQAVATKFNFSIMPVLFDLSSVNGEDTPTVYAQGGDIMNMTADKIATIAAELAKPAPTPPAQ
jgi:hypothetical protein